MRVIAGRLGGRMFDSPGTHRTHPMSDKMRGALFNILGDIKGLTVLDPFAGTGALSFEAVSRGAAQTTTIEIDKPAQQMIKHNIAKLGLEKEVLLINAAANAWLRTNRTTQFDLILCDPPYDDRQEPLIERLALHAKPSGLIVVSWPADGEMPRLAGLTQIDRRTYGDAQLVFYRRLQ